MLIDIQNLSNIRKSLADKYRKGVITSDELHLLEEIDNQCKKITAEIKKETHR